jgi:hypothetical protein
VALRADQLTPTLGALDKRGEAARRFGVQLQNALTRRHLRPYHVLKLVGGGWSARQFDSWLHGGSLPRLDLAVRLADALNWPALIELVREGRTGTCERIGCDRTFITETGRSRRYCSPVCQRLAHDYGVGSAHARRKKLGGEQAELHLQAAEGRAALEELGELRDAVAAMCNDCEPEGLCRTPTCSLRVVSPLPLARVFVRSTDPRLQTPNRVYKPTVARTRTLTNSA